MEEILGTVEGVAHPHDATMETDILPKEAPPPPPPLSEKEKGSKFSLFTQMTEECYKIDLYISEHVYANRL